MAITPKELRIYETAAGEKPFDEWLDGLRDRATVARIASRLNRVATGNFGDVKAIGDGVSELRLAFGPGYRIYFAQEKERIVLLLCGGDKGSQDRDIRSAKAYWEDYRRRDHGKKK